MKPILHQLTSTHDCVCSITWLKSLLAPSALRSRGREKRRQVSILLGGFILAGILGGFALVGVFLYIVSTSR